MIKTGWTTQKLSKNTRFDLKNVTSLTLLNAGKSKIFFREQTLEPEQTYVLEGDGSQSDIELDIVFENGEGLAILDYRSTTNNC